MRPIHIVGMGVTGSLIALMLAKSRIEFTWEDNDSDFTAWKASTGGIFPSGARSSIDYKGYEKWAAWQKAGLLPNSVLTTAPYWYNTKAAPHGAPNAEVGRTDKGMALYGLPSIHVNPQALVQLARKTSKGHRVLTAPKDSIRIIAHGYGETPESGLGVNNNGFNDGYQWGWSRKVSIKYEKNIARQGVELGDRPCFYFRDGKFIMAYLYPVPGELGWYLGSNMIRQTVPKRLSTQPKADRLARIVYELSKGSVRVTQDLQDEAVEGWRPMSNMEPGNWLHQYTPRVIAMQPMGSNGFRHAPFALARLFEVLKLELPV